MVEVIGKQCELVEADLQLLRDDHAIRESELVVGFRDEVRDQMRNVREEVERLGRVVGEVASSKSCTDSVV
jgi:hypothetical protein